MIDKIANILMARIKLKMPEIDEERAEVIEFGLNILIGEVPKLILLFVVSWILGILPYTALVFLIISPYRKYSGGIHFKTHIGCIIGTTLFFCGIAYVSKIVNITSWELKLAISIIVLTFSILVIRLYAPADTENIPILRKKDRRNKRIASYVFVTLMIIIANVINNRIISNMLIFGALFQSISICKFTYDIFKVKYGYLEYLKTKKDAV